MEYLFFILPALMGFYVGYLKGKTHGLREAVDVIGKHARDNNE